ncbi:MAG: DUF5312 domain-containing protein [Coriobacteriales bacterium]|jgi:hypothetical protein|nr:DUF5312 domain-containing protein [Coriobacteriales bacterium]
MDTLLDKLGTKVKGTITGFDRIVFKGIIRPIVHSAGMESFLRTQKVLNKDFKSWAQARSQLIVGAAEDISMRQCGAKITYIPSLNERKEALAHERQRERGITQGLVGVWSCVESCNTFRSVFNCDQTYPSLRFENSRCKHLYFYFDDPVFGFMSIRLQTWAPYEIQIALNGRQWLRRSLDEAGCGYLISGNKFIHIDDYSLAQELLDQQARVNFGSVLKGFLSSVFFCMQEVLGPCLSYYWTYWQSEVAKDYLFKDIDELSALMDDFQLHALITGKGKCILKYFGAHTKTDGNPYKNTDPQITSRTNDWNDGLRVRHWCNKNSVKFYNEHNVLRFEMTMNNPAAFKIHRHTQGQDKIKPKRFLPMRKGIADTAARVDVSKDALKRFTEHMAAVKEKTRLDALIEEVSSPFVSSGKRYRSLDVFGKDKGFVCAVSDPAGDVSAITNKDLQKALANTSWAKGMTKSSSPQGSAAICVFSVSTA